MQFLNDIVELGFIRPDNAPDENAAAVIPSDIGQPEMEIAEKTIFWWHDESCFHANEDQPPYWGDGTMHSIRPKSQGSGLMVSDFIEEKGGYLSLSDELYEAGKQQNPQLRKSARVIFQYGQAREGYWNNDTFMEQVEAAVDVAEVRKVPTV